MATKSAQQEPEKAEVIEEALDALDTALDRVKVLYEQYFLGIQKQPPTYLHTDIERKLRDLAQLQIRNTALRYRFATLQQKFGSYNSYWRRTLRQIENGTYTRNLFKIGRQAARTGAEVPPEILAAMPKRMRDQVMRDREAALALARLRERPQSDELELLTLADEDVDIDVDDFDLDSAAVIEESSELRRDALNAGGAYRIDESDADFDLDAFFASVTNEGGPEVELSPGVHPGRPPSVQMPVVGRAATRSDPRPPPDGQPAGHPRPGTLSGSPTAALVDELKLPGGRPRRTGRTGPGRRSTGRVAAARGGAAPSSPAPAAVVDVTPVEVTREESTGVQRRPSKSQPPSKHASTQALRGLRSAGSRPEPALPPPPPPQATRSIPVAPDAAPAPSQATRSIPVAPDPAPAPSQATRSIPVAPGAAAAASQGTRAIPVAPDPAPAPSQATRSIPVAPGAAAAASQGTRSIPVVPAAPAPSQATRSNPIAPGTAAAQAATPVETLAGPFPRIPGIPSLPSNLRDGGKAGPPAPSPPSSARERGAVPRILASSETDPTAMESDEPTDVMPAATPAWIAPPERPASAAKPPIPRAAVPDRLPPVAKPPQAERVSAPAQDQDPPAPVLRASTARPQERAASPGGAPQRPTPLRDRPIPPSERREPEPRQTPPPGMSDADVNALYAKYVKAKEILGESAGPGAYGKLLKTINAQAPRIMEQYNARGVDFSVVVKDNQVIIRAKPKP